MGVLLAALLPAGAGSAGVAAQVPTLDRADSLLTAGEYELARTTLADWWSARESFEVPGSDRPRALMLRARLAAGPEEAEEDYLAVVLGYPTSIHAPEALLRLGQGLLTAGDPNRAAAYLERLVADYPGRPQRLAALLWLARAHNAARRPAAACTAARAGLSEARDPDLAAMLRLEASVSCRIRTAETDERDDAPASDAATETPRSAGQWTVQTGAFRYSRSARGLMDRLREAGHEPRLVTVPGNDLLRVRVGRFRSSAEASGLVTRLRDQGFDAVVVRNAHEERTP